MKVLVALTLLYRKEERLRGQAVTQDEYGMRSRSDGTREWE